MALSSVIARFRTGTYAVTRTTAGSYSGGDYTPGGTSVINVDAAIQPLSGRDLQALPEGQYAKDLRVMYSTTALKTRTPTTDPDIVSVDSENWEVKTVEYFSGIVGGEHYKAIISRTVTP